MKSGNSNLKNVQKSEKYRQFFGEKLSQMKNMPVIFGCGLVGKLCGIGGFLGSGFLVALDVQCGVIFSGQGQKIGFRRNAFETQYLRGLYRFWNKKDISKSSFLNAISGVLSHLKLKKYPWNRVIDNKHLFLHRESAASLITNNDFWVKKPCRH